jgi:hypothetical protein
MEMMDFVYEIFLSYSKSSFTCRKMLHGVSGSTSPTKKAVLRTFIAAAAFESANLGVQ